MSKIKIKILKNGIAFPLFRGTSGAASFDISASEDVEWDSEIIFEDISINTVIVPTGLKIAIPENYQMQIFPRSGWGFKHNIQLANGTGIVDSDYRGEIFVKLYNIGDVATLPDIKCGTRIAQAQFVQTLSNNIDFDFVDELSKTTRGENGFGSTGA